MFQMLFYTTVWSNGVDILFGLILVNMFTVIELEAFFNVISFRDIRQDLSKGKRLYLNYPCF